MHTAIAGKKSYVPFDVIRIEVPGGRFIGSDAHWADRREDG